MSVEVPRPIDPALHPLATGNYRIITPAIEAFYDLVTKCLRYRIMGALIYGPPRIGKTRAIEYLRLLLARDLPKILVWTATIRQRIRRRATGALRESICRRLSTPAIACSTMRVNSGGRSRRPTTRPVSRAVWIFRWSRSRARWKSF